eukprot:28600_1
MSFKLKQVKHIHSKYKYIVFGYMRTQQLKLSLNDIPMLISYLCLSYYFHGEQLEKCGEQLRISGNKMTVTKISRFYGWGNTCYGKTWIQSNSNQIAKWTLKVDKAEAVDQFTSTLFISFVSIDNRMNEDCSQYVDKPNYCYGSLTSKYENAYCLYAPTSLNTKGKPKIKEGDTVCMILDTKRAIIYLENNGKKHELFQNIEQDNNIRYKLALSFYRKDTSVTLLDFDLFDDTN